MRRAGKRRMGRYNDLKKREVHRKAHRLFLFHTLHFGTGIFLVLTYGWAFHREEVTDTKNRRHPQNVCIMSHETIEPKISITGMSLAGGDGHSVVFSLLCDFRRLCYCPTAMKWWERPNICVLTRCAISKTVDRHTAKQRSPKIQRVGRRPSVAILSDISHQHLDDGRMPSMSE